MPQQARVTSVDALESVPGALIVYLSKARPTLEEVSADVLRTRLARKRPADTLGGAVSAAAATSCKRRRRPCSAPGSQPSGRKRRRSKWPFNGPSGRWKRRRPSCGCSSSGTGSFDGRVQPLVKQMEKLHTVLANDMVQAVAYLTHAVTRCPLTPASPRQRTPRGPRRPAAVPGGETWAEVARVQAKGACRELAATKGSGSSMHSRDSYHPVTQICNLPYRRLAVGRAPLVRPTCRSAAEYNSAIQQITNLRYDQLSS